MMIVKSLKLSYLLVLIVLVITSLAMVFHMTEFSHSRKTVRIAYTPVSCCLPLFVAHNRKYFNDNSENALDVELVFCASADVAVRAILDGTVDVVVQQNMSNIFAANAKAPNTFRCFMPTVETKESNFDFILVAGRSGITAIDQLKGKTIGHRNSRTDAVLTRLFLAKHGIDSKNDVTLLPIKPQELGKELIKGSIDAAVTVDPDATVMLNTFDDIQVLRRFYRGDILDPYPATCNMVQVRFLNERREEFGIIVRGMQRAVVDIEKDPIAALAVMAEKSGPGKRPYVAIDSNLAGKVGFPQFVMDYKEVKAELQSVLKIYADEKVIGTPVPDLDSLFISTEAADRPLQTDLPAPNSPPSVVIRNVSKALPRRSTASESANLVVSGLSLEIGASEIVALFGPNGIGKSTVLRLLAGLLRPCEGEIFINGVHPDQARIGLMFQNYRETLFPWFSAQKNLNIARHEERSIGNPSLALCHEAASSVLGDDFPLQAKTGTLSGGQQQRLCLARTMSSPADILILDEPYSALDYRAKIKCQSFLERSMLQRRIPAILVTHDIRDAIVLADRILVCSGLPFRVVDEVPVPLPRPRSYQMFEDHISDCWPIEARVTSALHRAI